jgi:two-component system, OmpR family, phosphate regulon sensor histidine kinase PhoR
LPLDVRLRLFVASLSLVAVVAVSAVALVPSVGPVRAGALAIAIGALLGWAASTYLSRLVRDLLQRLRSQVTPLRTGIDAVDELAGSIQQIESELEASMRTIAAERDQFGAVLESMTEAVLALDDAERVELFNRAATELFGVTARGIPLPPTVRIPALDGLLREAKLGRAGSEEVSLAGDDERVLRLQVSPQRDGRGVVIVIHDVSQMRKLERMRRDFVANVSHELRTPVSVIQANAETLLGGALADDPARAHRFAEAILRNSERLGRLISDLLDIARIESDRQTLTPGPVHVLGVARRARDVLVRPAWEAETSLELAISPDLGVDADPRALEQVLRNLMENAIKYSPARSHVLVVAEPTASGRVRIEVQDDGLGIQPQHRERIFERFYRVDPGRSRDMGGTGLGLSIVKHLIQSMGGVVGYAPNEPKGSIFWIELETADVPDEETSGGEPR